MKSTATIPEEYISQISADRLEAFTKLRKTILDNLPVGFTEEMSYGMIGYVVPFSIYPKGYHTNPKLPLPFINIASQKNFIAFHHLGIYLNPGLLEWFTNEYPKYSNTKLDMGKGCIRFKNMSQIPYALVGELVRKTTLADWVNLYESIYLKNKSH